MGNREERRMGRGDRHKVRWAHDRERKKKARGTGTLETDYGPLRYREGDFLTLPKGATHRVVPEDGETFLYIVEGRGEYHLPEKGILGKHALFDPGVLETPDPQPHDEKGEFEVRVKRDGQYTALT